MSQFVEDAVAIAGEVYRRPLERSAPGEWIWRAEGPGPDLVVARRAIEGGSVKIWFEGDDEGVDIRSILQNRQAVPVRLNRPRTMNIYLRTDADLMRRNELVLVVDGIGPADAEILARRLLGGPADGVSEHLTASLARLGRYDTPTEVHALQATLPSEEPGDRTVEALQHARRFLGEATGQDVDTRALRRSVAALTEAVERIEARTHHVQ